VLAGVEPPVLSPDGTSLYARGLKRSAVVHFERDPSTGALTYRDCITGGRNPGDICRAMPSPTLDSLRPLAVSPDGRSLYAGGGAVVARFARDPATGALDLSSCISGYVPRRPRRPVCFPIRHATPTGYGSGLGSISSVVASGGPSTPAPSATPPSPTWRWLPRPRSPEGPGDEHESIRRSFASAPASPRPSSASSRAGTCPPGFATGDTAAHRS
jgi:hypothetical protein